MCRRIIVLIVFIISIVLTSYSFNTYDFNEVKYIQVEVKGHIENPGIFKLPLGSTIADLFDYIILKKDSDTSNLSKLEVLKNNQIIVVTKQNMSDLISINCANLYELSSLPGIGKSIAIKIIDYRNKYGSFIKL